jgi:hypothetical protein
LSNHEYTFSISHPGKTIVVWTLHCQPFLGQTLGEKLAHGIWQHRLITISLPVLPAIPPVSAGIDA